MPPTTETPRANDPLAALPRQDRHRPKGPPMRRSRATRWRILVLVAVHVLIAVHVAHWLLAGRTVSPVEPSEAMQTIEEGVVNAGFVFFVLAIGSTLVFGRWFCGWACHVVALQDLSAGLLGKLGLRPRPVRSRLLVLAPWAVAFYMFAWPSTARWLGLVEARHAAELRWEPMTDDLLATFAGPLMAVLTFLVVGFLVVWWLGAKGFCTYGCPYGAIFATVDRFAPMRIRVDRDACEHCGHCTQACSSNVRVHEEVARHGMVVDPGCMKCMDCVSVCPKDALSVGFGGIKPFATSQQRIRARADFTWPEEILLAITGVAGMLALRGAWFGEQVPFLMSVGLGAITAVFALLLVRLLLRRDVTFQHTPLKREGRLSGKGLFAYLFAALWIVFVVHTGVVNVSADVAVRDSVAALRQHRAARGSVDEATFRDLEERLARVDSIALATPPMVLAVHGLVLRELGRHELAVQQLERMAARQGLDRLRMREADLALAIYEGARGNGARAGELAERVLEQHPDDATALEILRRLGR